MEEKDLRTNQENQKLEWEAPRLHCLDKGKTEGGTFTGTPEGTSYIGTQSS